MRLRVSEIPYAPVSWGELIDKITILEIKADRIKNYDAQKNIMKELTALREFEIKIMNDSLLKLKDELFLVNSRLWDIEDELRDHEAEHNFDEKFIKLARSVYFTNDQRAKIKREINAETQSEYCEEKSYSSY